MSLLIAALLLAVLALDTCCFGRVTKIDPVLGRLGAADPNANERIASELGSAAEDRGRPE